MYFMHQYEITWTQTLYPQYQIHEHRLNSLTIDCGQFRYIKMKLPLQRQDCFIQEMEISWFLHFVVFIFIHGFETMIHLQNTINLVRIVKFISLFQDINYQSTIQYHRSFMKITNVCYNVFHYIRSTFLNINTLSARLFWTFIRMCQAKKYG